MKKTYGIKYILISLFLILPLINHVFAVEEYNNGSGTGEASDGDGSDYYQEGGSAGSTNIPDTNRYVRVKVYLGPTSGSTTQTSNSTVTEVKSCTGNCTLLKIVEYVKGYRDYDTSCNSTYSGSYSSSSNPNGCGTSCVKSESYYTNTGTTGAGCANPCLEDTHHTCEGSDRLKCYRQRQQDTATRCIRGSYQQKNSGCATVGEVPYSGCGSPIRTSYNYQTTSSFPDITVSDNWKRSEEVGTYYKWGYVYSYPQNINVVYDGNGADKLCQAGNETGTNTGNSNTNIKYVDGNPVCSTNLTDGTMPDSSLSFTTGGILSKNLYYKTGYDFIGWVTDINNADGQLVEAGTVIPFEDEEEIAYDDPLIAAAQLSGGTITFHAVGKPHEYSVAYQTLCGTNTNLGTYKYGEGLTLSPINTTTCTGDNEGAIFLGWYEDNLYTKYLVNIPATYYKDLTLYAKLGQARYYNYQERGGRKLSNAINNTWEYEVDGGIMFTSVPTGATWQDVVDANFVFAYDDGNIQDGNATFVVCSDPEHSDLVSFYFPSEGDGDAFFLADTDVDWLGDNYISVNDEVVLNHFYGMAPE